MNASDIKNYAITSSYSEKSDISDSTLTMYLNIEYHKFAKLIKEKVRWDYFYDIFTTDIIENQNEYSFEPSATDNVGIENILSVDVKRWDTWYNLKYRDNANNNISLTDKEQYGGNMFDIKDSSLFIYPTPTENVVRWLIVQALTGLKDLTLTDTESLIYPWHTELRPYHFILWIGMRQHIFQMQWMYNEKIDAINEYEREVQKALNALKGRYKSSITQSRLDLSYYAN